MVSDQDRGAGNNRAVSTHVLKRRREPLPDRHRAGRPALPRHRRPGRPGRRPALQRRRHDAITLIHEAAPACPAPSTTSACRPSSPPTPAARPSSTTTAPTPRSPRSRQTDHHAASTHTKAPPDDPGGAFHVRNIVTSNDAHVVILSDREHMARSGPGCRGGCGRIGRSRPELASQGGQDAGLVFGLGGQQRGGTVRLQVETDHSSARMSSRTGTGRRRPSRGPGGRPGDRSRAGGPARPSRGAGRWAPAVVGEKFPPGGRRAGLVADGILTRTGRAVRPVSGAVGRVVRGFAGVEPGALLIAGGEL